MSAPLKLPHGNVAIGAVKDPVVRDVFMKINENIARLLTLVTELNTAVEAANGEGG